MSQPYSAKYALQANSAEAAIIRRIRIDTGAKYLQELMDSLAFCLFSLFVYILTGSMGKRARRGLIVKRLRRRPFTAETWVRFPLRSLGTYVYLYVTLWTGRIAAIAADCKFVDIVFVGSSPTLSTIASGVFGQPQRRGLLCVA